MKVTNQSPEVVQDAKKNSEAKKAQKAERTAAYQAEKAAASNAPSKTAVATDISARGRELAQAKELARQAPDVREERILDLKKKIAEGTYMPEPSAVAESLIKDHLEHAGHAQA